MTLYANKRINFACGWTRMRKLKLIFDHMAERKDRRGKKDGRSRFGKQKKSKVLPEYTGRVQMTREGYIFVIVDGLDDDVFVKASKTMGALNGDTVRVAVTKEKTDRMRKEGKVIDIVSRSPRPFVGILHVVGNQAWVLMQSRTMPYDIGISIEDAAKKGAVSGMKVAESSRSYRGCARRAGGE